MPWKETGTSRRWGEQTVSSEECSTCSQAAQWRSLLWICIAVVFAPVTIPQVRVLLQERHSLRHRTAELYSVMALCPSWGAYPVQMRTSMGHFFGVSFLQPFWGKNMFQKGRTKKIAHKNLQPFMNDRSHEHSNILCQERFSKLRIGSIQPLFSAVVTCAGDAAATQGQSYLNPPWGLWILEWVVWLIINTNKAIYNYTFSCVFFSNNNYQQSNFLVFIQTHPKMWLWECLHVCWMHWLLAVNCTSFLSQEKSDHLHHGPVSRPAWLQPRSGPKAASQKWRNEFLLSIPCDWVNHPLLVPPHLQKKTCLILKFPNLSMESLLVDFQFQNHPHLLSCQGAIGPTS